MKKGLYILLITVALLAVTVVVAYAITNGEPDGDAHSYVGLLVFDVFVPGVGNVPAWRCSGSLIAPDVVLTAGHCTDGAVAARVWFYEDVTYDNVPFPLYPYGGPGSGAIEGTPHTNPDFCIGCGNGLPGFAIRDVGIVVLDHRVKKKVVKEYAELPDQGLVDTLANKTDLTVVGYGVQSEHRGGGPPYWEGLRIRLFAPSQLVSEEFVHSDEFIKMSLNHSQGKGGTCFGDSGGPDLLGGTDIVLAVNSYVTNYNCAGVGYSSRVDIQEVLDWINSFPQ